MSNLIAVHTNGEVRVVDCSYEGIKAGLNGATLDFLRLGAAIGLYVDDEGMLNGSQLNVAASMFCGMALWGPVVLCHGDPDDEGETLPASPVVVDALTELADQWHLVVSSASYQGQEITVSQADPETVPPPIVISWEGR